MDCSLVKILALVLCLALAGLAPAGGELIPVGEEVPILDSGCNEEGLDVAPLPGGGFVAVWARRHPDPAQPAVPASSLYARVIGGDGRGLGPAQRLAGSTVNGEPAVAVNEDGRILVAWLDPAEAGGAVAQVFDVDGGRLLPVPGRTATVIPRSSPGSGLDAAPLEDGFAVLVTEGGSASLARFAPNGALRGSEVIRPPDTFLPVWSLSNPRMVSRGSSALVAAWNGTSGEQRRIEARVLGVVPSPILVVRSSESTGAGLPGAPAVASSADGNFFVAWREETNGMHPVYGRAFDGAGTPEGDAFLLHDWGSLSDPALANDGDGGFVLAWIQTAPIGPPLPELAVSLLSPQGVVQSSLLMPGDLGDLTRIQLVRGEGQRLILAVEPTWEVTPDPCHTSRLFARFLDLTRSALTLQEGRFRASVRWTDHQGQSGEGRAVPLTGDSGYFWFFGRDNVELMVKVLDGRAVNNRFWVFYASLSDVAYTLTVTDTATGLTRDYVNPAGQLASRGDTATFLAGPPENDVAITAGVSEPAAAAVTMEKAGPCTDPSLPVSIRPGLCLGSRFEVEVSWRNPAAGTSGAGQGVRLTTDSGYLWFFGANNVELVVKVLDGRAVNGHFWVFYGAMSNVEYTVQVRNMVTGAVRTYVNPAGQLASRADTAAF